MATQKKMDTVTELSEKIAKAKSIVVADYRGFKNKQMQELRRAVKKVDGEFVVAKNRLMKRALGDTAESIQDALNDTSAFLFSYADEVAPLKELLKFFKAANMGKTKAGLIGKTALSDAEVDRLSQLPGKDTLRARVVGQMMAPLYGLHYSLSWNLNKLVWAINNIKDQKSKIKDTN